MAISADASTCPIVGRPRSVDTAGVPVAVESRAQDDDPDDDAPLLTHRPSTIARATGRDAAHLREAASGAPMHLVRDGVDASPSHGADDDGPLLCVSRMVPRDGIATLIAAFGLLADDRPSLDLEVIGHGPLDVALRARVRALDLADRVHFRGPLAPADVQAALHRCSMLVLPGPIDEPGDQFGLPAVVLGAMACGTPVVTTDTAGLPRMIRHDATGLLVAPNAPAGLAVAIATLLDDPVRAAVLGAAGQRLVGRLQDREKSSDRLQRIWQEIGR
jgi:glycosyltransferase involved in cell wall biosynthesis